MVRTPDPETVGSDEATGLATPTVALAGVATLRVPLVLVAVTVALRVDPRSAALETWTLSCSPEIGAQLSPLESQRDQEYVKLTPVAGDQAPGRASRLCSAPATPFRLGGEVRGGRQGHRPVEPSWTADRITATRRRCYLDLIAAVDIHQPQSPPPLPPPNVSSCRGSELPRATRPCPQWSGLGLAQLVRADSSRRHLPP